MTSHVEHFSTNEDSHPVRAAAAAELAVPVGRVLFAAIFVTASLNHFTSAGIAYAASNGVPLASLAVPLSGAMALLGGIGIALGYKTRISAALLVLFLVPVTLFMHPFWTVHNPMMHQIQQVMFMKNLSMLGGALLLGYFGAGPYSLDRRNKAQS